LIYSTSEHYTLYHGNCLDEIRTIPDASIDAIITDPPYPCVIRDYGQWTIEQWFDLMSPLLDEFKRVLTPTGSAVLILQPNSEHVGTMRSWLWEFLAYCCQSWNVIQDVYWWNYTAPPNVHTQRKHGLLRPSIKYCVWLGSPNCYRNQDSILWTISDATKAKTTEDRAFRRTRPSGFSFDENTALETCRERNGTTPYNLIPSANSNSTNSSGAYGHSAGTSRQILDWWVKYICPNNAVVLDPFNGCGTTGLSAIEHGHRYIGIEQHENYLIDTVKRLDEVIPSFS